MSDAIQSCLLKSAIEAYDEASESGLFKIPPTSVNESWITSFAQIKLNDGLRLLWGGGTEIFVTAETTVDYMDCFFGRIEDHPLGLKNRFDLVLWGPSLPFAVVEIKHSRNMSGYDQRTDAAKLFRALDRWAMLEEGYFLFSSHLGDKKKAEFERYSKGTGLQISWMSEAIEDCHWHCARVFR